MSAQNLGYAWIVPYKGKATFQLGYKGYIQLALRTGQYKAINVIEVREGELIKWNRLTEKIELDLDAATSDKVIGYCGYCFRPGGQLYSLLTKQMSSFQSGSGRRLKIRNI
ncbi:phage RecT family recombinase [Cytobacillus firmus]|uniref:Phage RecT family recombinase n=2 Tax=Cytobacillus TaxID=2675230 RepID=A0A366JLJ2_CYTFI|nr:phage RecT family recombinase [Cytobacillus firmus]TDX39234.1 phage RecT family recombinase [Cytobacillus oceanisediminis]